MLYSNNLNVPIGRALPSTAGFLDPTSLETSVGNILKLHNWRRCCSTPMVRSSLQSTIRFNRKSLRQNLHTLQRCWMLTMKKAILQAKHNIEVFHKLHNRRAVKIIETMPGVQCWRKPVAIEKVGLYTPGGSRSSVLHAS